VHPLEPMLAVLEATLEAANVEGRPQTLAAEPVFGQIKSVMGCRGFLRRGLEAGRSWWSLMYACCNLLQAIHGGVRVINEQREVTVKAL